MTVHRAIAPFPELVVSDDGAGVEELAAWLSMLGADIERVITAVF